jgi:hypothetical protein
MHNSSHYCPIRNRQVSLLPEEKVRVATLKVLVDQLAFPKSGIVVEKELSQMAHLNRFGGPLPQRRADIVCFAKGIHPTQDLYPLLLIECKSVKLTKKMRNQVIGYNHFLQAYFIALVNQHEVCTAWLDHSTGEYRWISHLPSYRELMDAL